MVGAVSYLRRGMFYFIFLYFGITLKFYKHEEKLKANMMEKFSL